MLQARVIGRAIATIKHPSLEGRTMLLVQPLLTDVVTPDGDPLLAVDCVGAGRGEMVVITSDGRGAREILGVEATPVRWTTIGISDECP